jgi:hypothetical protein
MVFKAPLTEENHPKFIVLKSNSIVVGMIELLPLTLQILRYYHTECIGESEARLTGPEKKKPNCLLPGNPAISSRPVAFRPRLAAGLAFSIWVSRL